jgi:hypothetical protein
MKIAVLTACTNRKRMAPSADLSARTLDTGSTPEVLQQWVTRLHDSNSAFRFAELYQGRGFQDARQAALDMNASHLIVSAGLGLLNADAIGPSYSLTVSAGQPDSIQPKITSGFDAAHWWKSLCMNSPFSTTLDWADTDIVVAALPKEYLRMATDLLSTIAASTALRILIRDSVNWLPASLSGCVIRYDGRLDGTGSTDKGTMSDFAARAARHFGKHVLNHAASGTQQDHQALVENHLSQFEARTVPERQKMSDASIMELISKHWNETSGQSGRMLRHLRDNLNVACEQSRFKNLFHQVANARLQS